jgi:hypothetical protein
MEGDTDVGERSGTAFGRSPPIMDTTRAGQIRCNRWSERMQVTGQVECKRVVKRSAISHSIDLEELGWKQV